MIKAHCGGLKSPIACESCGVFSLTPVDKNYEIWQTENIAPMVPL